MGISREGNNMSHTCLTILVAGHRRDRLLPDKVPAVSALIERMLLVLQQYRQKHEEKSAYFSLPTIRVITGSSSGVDKIAARVAEKLGISTTILGFEDDACAEADDGVASASTILFPSLASATPSLKNALVAARDEIALSYCDILIAIWDGKNPEGYAGGTVRLIRDAAIYGRAVIVLGLDGSIRRLPSLQLDDATQRNLSYSDAEPDFIDSLLVNYNESELAVDIALLLTGNPDPSLIVPKPILNFDHMRAGQAQKHKIRRPGLLDGMLTAFSSREWQAVKRAWAKDPFTEYYGVSEDDMPAQMRQAHPIAEPKHFRSRFKVHDIKANCYSGKYRDANWIIYGLSALAVFSAVAGATGLAGGRFSGMLWALVELGTLAAITCVYCLANRGRWHELWLKHRYQAELIRYARMCAPVLAPLSVLKEKIFTNKENDSGISSLQSNWEQWTVRRLIIDEGLPMQRTGNQYQLSLHLTENANYVAKILADQMNFHKNLSSRNDRAAHTLHRLTEVCFVLTGVAILGHFALHSPHWLLLTAALPAFAAAIHGVATHNEFERIGAVSSATHEELKVLSAALRNYHVTDEHPAKAWLVLQKITIEAANAMSGATRQWHEIVLHKSTALPS